jgi:C4-dicarboxylate-specific signal transduction histidine kinase
MVRVQGSPLLSLLLVGLTLTIFAVDAFTPLDVAIAVMYVVVVLLSASVWRRRGVMLTSAVCLGLTLLAYALSHAAFFSGPAAGRMVVSLAAIGITAYLALRWQAATNALIAREEALHRSQAQLAHVTRVTMLGELAASIAHEVNQPLAAIATNGEASLRWLNRPQPDLGEARSAIASLLEAAGRASEVIRRIRALARRSDPRHLPLALNDVAQEAAGLVRRELASHQVSLKLELAPGLPPVRGDRVQLQQVLINLLMNAMQAMQAGVQNAPGQAVLLRTGLCEQGGVLCSVSDTGPGIPPEHLPKLFDAFFSTKEDGMGMGLPICRSIIETHGGRIWAGPAPQGAVLHFSLPAMEADPA